MDKPSEVRAGQWWLHEMVLGPEPRRVDVVVDGAPRFGTLGLLPKTLLSEEAAVYLGDGERPEPSGWLIETCARHVLAMGGSTRDGADRMLLEAMQHARSILVGGDSPWPRIASAEVIQRAVVSLAGILRGMGRW